MKSSVVINSFGLALAVTVVGGASAARSATLTWNSAATGTNWSAASNWGGTVPGSGDIGLFASASYNAQPALAATASLGGIWDTGSAPLTIGGSNSLSLFGTTISGHAGTGIEMDGSSGSLTINAPLVLQNNQQWINNSTKTLTVNGAVSGSGSLTFLGRGALVLAGNNVFNDNLTIAGGTLQLPSGALPALNEYVGTGGTAAAVVQTGGTNSVSSDLYLGFNGGSSGAYALSGSSLLWVTGPGVNGSEYVGYSGSGAFTQSGGTNLANNVYIGSQASGGSGTYSLNGGLLSATTTAATGFEYVGNGTFTLSGGTNLVNELEVDGGGYSLSGNALLSATNSFSHDAPEYIGFARSGSFTQTSGTNTAGDLVLAQETGSYGVYNLNGGLLLMASSGITQGSGSAAFNFGGGTLGATAPWSSSINMTLTGSGGNSTVDTTGGSIALSGNLTGSGTLCKVGGRVLSVSGTNSSIGGLLVNGGTVQFPGGSLAVPIEYVGYSGSGGFTQSGGTNSLASGLYVGYNSGGSYNLSGGSLYSSNYETVGSSGSGNFTQSGGTNSLAGTLYLGFAGGAVGSYNLTGGSLYTPYYEVVGSGGSGSFTQSGGTNSATTFLQLGQASGAVGSYNLSGGSLYSSSEFIGVLGSGSFTQSGGTNVASILYVGDSSGGVGSYNLSGSGSLAAPYELVGFVGSGSFTQTGGTNSAGSLLLADTTGNYGVYNLNGGLLLMASSGITQGSGSAAFNFGGGSLGATAPWSSSINMTLTGSGGNSTVDTSGGSIALSGNLTGSGTLSKVGGGVLSVSGTNSGIGGLLVNGGTLQIPGGSFAAPYEYVGYSGSGSVTQSGGTNNSGLDLYIGFNTGGSGAYSLSGSGLLASVFNEYVSYSGSGSFTQSGGTNSIGGTLIIGWGAGSSGNYNLGNGLLTAPDGEYIGYSGSGSFTQTGGTNSSVGQVYLGYNPGSYGVYNLDGGLLLLSSGGITQGSGSANFNFGGGTLGANGAWSSSINMTLTGSGGNATIDTTGGNIGLSGVLSGSGGLNKAGTGTLSLAGPNTYSGATSILAGTLLLANSNAVQNSTVNLLVGNGLEFLPGISTFNLGGLSGAQPLTLSNSGGSAIALSVGGNGASTTYSGNIGGNGGLVKVGTGRLTFAGTNSFTGGTTISGGALGFTATSAVPGTGVITIGPSGALVATPIYNAAAPVSSWLAGGRIVPSSSGAIALPNGTNDNESIALSATSSGLSLGAIGSATYSGALTTAASTVYLGGGGGNLYFTPNLSGSDSLAVGTRGVPGGSVILTGGNALGGTLRVDGGTLQLPSGSLTMTSTASGYEYVGYSGTATFTQSGGTNTVGTALVLGQNPGSVGTYNLLGGLLVVPSISGSGSLNITGGSLTAATGALTVASPIVLSAAGSNGTFNTSGSSITLAGQISGGGGLTKTGPSTLVLAAANTYTGGTTVAQGTLLLTNSNAAQNTSINVAVNDGLQFGTGVGSFNIGALGGAGDLVLADTAGHAITAITGGNSATATYSGAISGGGTLVHGGPGVLVLNGVNSYTGGTILTPSAGPGGVVVYSQSSFVGPYTFAGNNSLGFAVGMSATNAITFDSGVTGAIDTLGNMVTLTGLMSGGGTLNKIDSGTLVLSDSNSLSGAAAISQGSLQLANANAATNSTVAVNADNGLQFSPGIGAFNVGGLSGSGALALSDTGGAPVNLSVGGNNQNTTYTGMIVGAGTLTKAGTGALDLTGSNTWEGGLFLEPGVVAFSRDAALGAPTNRITFVGSDTLQAQASVVLSPSRGITVNSGATAMFDPGGNVLTVDGVIGGAGTLAVVGSGTLVLANTNTYSGGTVVSSGALEAASTGALPGAFTSGKLSVGSGASLIVAVGGPQQWTAAEANQLLAVPNLFRAGAGFGIDASGGSFNPNSINYSGRVLTLAGSNSYSGVVAVSQGTLELANSAALINSTVEIDAGNVLQFGPGAGTFFLGGLSGGKHLDLDDTSSGGVALIVGGNGQSTTFSGQITGGGSLTLAGSGRLVLTGTNDYSGGTNVTEGTLIAMTNYALDDGSSVSVGNASLFAAAVPASAVGTVSGLNGGTVAVPEPSALALLAAGSLLAAAAAAGLKKPRAATV